MSSIGLSSLGAFMAPLEQEFGWKRAEISSGLAIYSIAGVLFAPVLGSLVDRWGPRRFGVLGVIACGAAFAAFGTTSNAIVGWLALWALFSIAAQVPRPLIWSAAISSEFSTSRGLALAVVFSGGAVGGLVAPILAGSLIESFGWRSAYAIMGGGWGALAGLGCYLFFYGRCDRIRGMADSQSIAIASSHKRSVIEALSSATFVKLATSTLLANVLFVGLFVHMIPLLDGLGLSRHQAIALAALMSVAAIPGQLICGVLADRLSGNIISSVSLGSMALACALLLLGSHSIAFLILPVVLIGFTGGERIQMLPYIVTRFFGLENFGKIFGVVASIMGLAAGIGPVLSGYIFDLNGSYEPLLLCGIPVGLLAALLMLSVGRYPPGPPEADGREASSFPVAVFE
jgi:MFS family permease